MTAITSIDHAASGFLRHRFVRALSASWLVLILVGVLAAVVQVAFSQSATAADAAELVGTVLGVVVFLAVFLIPVIFLGAIAGAVLDSLHRRLAALIAIVPLCLVLVTAPLGIIGAANSVFAPSSQSGAAQENWENWAGIALLVFSGLTAWEGAVWAWWQLTTSREGFLAARGFRAPPWRLLTTFRRQLGLPPFISNLGRGRLSLTLLYFTVAALNVGIVCLLVLPVLMFGLREAENREITIGMMTGVAVLLLLNLFRVGRIFRLARRPSCNAHLSGRARLGYARSDRVFLRAFDQDDARLPALTRDPFLKFPAGVGSPRTPDEILLEHASPYGPVIAIGDPRDPTPPLGAARVHAPGEGLAWQDIVKGLVSASKAVVMCPKDTEGVKWELDLIERAGARERTIYLANPELSGATNETLFARLAPEGAAAALPKGQAAIAAFFDPKQGWRVLTTSKPPGVQTYVIALNMALQAMFGEAKLPAAFRAERKTRTETAQREAA